MAVGRSLCLKVGRSLETAGKIHISASSPENPPSQHNQGHGGKDLTSGNPEPLAQNKEHNWASLGPSLSFSCPPTIRQTLNCHSSCWSKNRDISLSPSRAAQRVCL